MDWRLGPKYAIKGFLAGSSVRGDAGRSTRCSAATSTASSVPTRPTWPTILRARSLNGYGGSATFSKIGGERVRFTTNVGVKSPGFEINDVGFLRRADQRTMSNWVQVRYETPMRSTSAASATTSISGRRGTTTAIVFIRASTSTPTRCSRTTGPPASGGNINPQPFDDRGTRGGPGVYGNAQRSIWAYIESDERPAVSVGVFTFSSTDGKGTTYHDAQSVRVVSSVVVPESDRRPSLEPKPRRIAVGRSDRRWAVRLRAAASADRRPDRRG